MKKSHADERSQRFVKHKAQQCCSQESLHYICMQAQLGSAMNMNNKAVVSAAVSINSVLHMVAV